MFTRTIGLVDERIFKHRVTVFPGVYELASNQCKSLLVHQRVVGRCKARPGKGLVKCEVAKSACENFDVRKMLSGNSKRTRSEAIDRDSRRAVEFSARECPVGWIFGNLGAF